MILPLAKPEEDIHADPQIIPAGSQLDIRFVGAVEITASAG